MSAYELTKTILKDSSSLKAYYRFESGALTTDSSGNSKTLTNNNTVAETTGVYGGAATQGTGNTNKYFSISDSLGIDGGACTYSMWFKANAEITSGDWYLFYQTNNTSKTAFNALYQYNAGTRRLQFNRVNVGGTTGQLNYNITLGTTWHHIVYTYDGTTVRAYLDGSYIGSFAHSGTGTGATESDFEIGAAYTGSTLYSPASASFDDFAVFGVALSADQIKELYEGRYIGEWLPQSGLVGLWHLNGNSTDTSGNNNHGTDTAITYSLANGKIAQGADFNNASSKITVTSVASLNFATSPFTVMGWVNADGIGATDTWINKFSGTVGWSCGRLNTNKFFFYASDGTTNQLLTGNLTVSSGTWYHVACVSEATNSRKIYVNGALDNTGTTNITGTLSNASNLVIGTYETGSEWWDGKIDEVAIFSRALTAAEIRKWYAHSVGKLQ